MNASPRLHGDLIVRVMDRLEEGLQLLGADWQPSVTRVTRYIDTSLTPPYWWLYPGIILNEPIGSQDERIPVVISARLVIGVMTEGYDGANERLLPQWILDTLIFFAQHRALNFSPADQSPPYLDAGNVRVRQTTPVGPFSNTQFVGVEFQIVTPFRISIRPAPGN